MGAAIEVVMSDLPPSLSGVSVAQLSSQRTLHLKSRGISDADCAAIAPALAQNTALQQLYIGYNSFGDEGARHLCQAFASQEDSRLELLGLRHCRLGDDGASAVAELLKTSRTLTDAGAEELAEAVRENHVLRHLYVGMNKI